MNCRQVDDYIYAYCDNTLSPEQRILFDRHLKDCEVCRNKLRLTLLENEILKDPGDIPALSEDFNCRLMKTIKSNNKITQQNDEKLGFSKAMNAFKTRLPCPVIISTAIAVILLLVIFIPGITDMRTGFNVADNNGVKNNASSNLHQEKNEQIDICSGGISQENIAKTRDVPDEIMKSCAASNPDNSTSSFDNNSIQKIYSDEVHEFKDPEQSISQYDNAEILHLHPINLPSAFKLATIISDTDDRLIFIYNNIETGDELKIRIAAAGEPDAPRGMGEGGEEESPTPEYTTSQSKQSTETIIKRDINYSNQTYTVIISSRLSPEELASLAASIEFEEVE